MTGNGLKAEAEPVQLPRPEIGPDRDVPLTTEVIIGELVGRIIPEMRFPPEKEVAVLQIDLFKS
ncbi:hypothetical protein ISS42_00075 [Candidatus Shapirobacteria bacterium]|nr:hypothetical protein [Candidatus Shapirobacteria bacterium]